MTLWTIITEKDWVIYKVGLWERVRVKMRKQTQQCSSIKNYLGNFTAVIHSWCRWTRANAVYLESRNKYKAESTLKLNIDDLCTKVMSLFMQGTLLVFRDELCTSLSCPIHIICVYFMPLRFFLRSGVGDNINY